MDHVNFQNLVDQFYASLYHFALSLARNENDASDLTQQTFWVWATKGHQLRDQTKVKSWLFTTLHRQFLTSRRHEAHHPHQTFDESHNELPSLLPTMVESMDAKTVLHTLTEVDEIYRSPLMLFYLQERSYKEIAEALGIPIGTVMSRISRGKKQLREKLIARSGDNPEQVISWSQEAYGSAAS